MNENLTMEMELVGKVEKALIDDGYSVKRLTVNKQFGPSEVLCVGKENQNVAVNIPLKAIMGLEEDEVSDYVNFIKERVTNIPNNLFTFDIKDTSDYRVCLIPRNEDYLKNAIWKPFLDLAIVVKKVFYDADSSASTLVLKEMLKSVNLTEDQAFDLAMKQTMSYLRFDCKSMYQTLKSFGDIKDFDDFDDFDLESLKDDYFPAVVTSKSTCNASSLFLLADRYLKALSEASDNGKFFIVPSSTQELLIYPFSDNEELVADLKNCIRETNENFVCESEVLSNNLYLCDKGVLSIA